MTFTPDLDCDDVPVVVGSLADGREVLALRGEGIVERPSIEELVAAQVALHKAAGL